MDGTAHSVIVLRKIKPTPAQYPRRYAKINQMPLSTKNFRPAATPRGGFFGILLEYLQHRQKSGKM